MPSNEQAKLNSVPDPEPSAEDLAHLTGKLPVPVWVFDYLQHVVYLNQEAADFHEGDEIGASIKEFSPEFKKALATLLRDCISSGEILTFEGWITTPMRGKNYLQITAVPLPRDLVACVVTNQTAFKSAELAVMKSEERYRELVDSLSEGISVIDTTGVCEFANPAMERILGVGAGQLLGRNIGEFLQIDSTTPRQLSESATHRDPIVHESSYTRPDGEVRDLLISIVARFDTRGHRIGSLALTQDITMLKRVEEALRQERNFTSAIIDTSSALVIVLDRRGRIFRYNRGCEELSGYRADEVIGKTVWDILLIPQEIEAVKIVFAELSAKTQPLAFENYWLTKDGEKRLISWSNSIIFDAEGEVEFIVGIGVDITERNEAVEMLYQSEKTARALLDALVDPALLVTPDCVIVALNEAAVNDGGLPPDDVIGKRFDEMMPKEIGARRAKVIQQVFISKKPYRYLDETGDQWFDVTVRPILNSQNQVVLLAIHAREVTEHKLAEQKLSASERRFRSLVETMREGVIVRDRDYNIVFVNQALCELLGRSYDELVKINLVDLLEPNEFQKVLKSVEEQTESGALEPYVVSLIGKGGHWLQVEVTPQPALTEEDLPDSKFAIVRQIKRQ